MLSGIKLRDLRLTDYSRAALKRTLKAAEYYLEIYRNSLEIALERCPVPLEKATVVDFGGGHGLLSVLAKMSGVGRVIYVDTNPDAVHTAHQLSQKLGAAPDVFLQGSSGGLLRWCRDNEVCPDALLAMDVIEHVYVLDEFFADLHTISPTMKMVFTTASTPYNKRVVRRLHQAMEADELGTTTKKGFWQMRREYIQKLHPDMPDSQLDYWADNTRGLRYEDVARAVEAQSPNLLLDPHNTCDPATGSWTERILPVEDYRQLLSPYGYGLEVLPGHYNEHRHGPKAIASRHYNKIIGMAPKGTPSGFRQRRRYRKALKVAPFLYFVVEGNR